jgi:hypothetical protein
MEDDRLAKDSGMDLVGSKSSRRSQDREVTENRELTEQDRLEMFRNTLFNDALPDLPNTPGYHVCWLTTTNPRDPIRKRLQLGYELLTPDMAPGLVDAAIPTGEYAGVIGINEMLAARIPMSLYEAFMQEAHHDAPRSEEEKLSNWVDSIRDDVERRGAKLEEGDGLSEMRQSAPSRGVFSG